MLASLVLFWVASGLVALVIAFPATKSILASHGFPRRPVTPFVGLSGVMEISAGILIAFRRTLAIGLVAGMFISLGHMVGTAIVAPRSPDRAARLTGEEGPRDRADAGGAADVGRPTAFGD